LLCSSLSGKAKGAKGDLFSLEPTLIQNQLLASCWTKAIVKENTVRIYSHLRFFFKVLFQ
jgi:hypothetical protein